MPSGLVSKSDWDVIIEKAIREDGSLLFPERLTPEFLNSQRRSMGSYFFANQYQNEIIPEGEQTFKKHWIRYFADLPPKQHTFIFIDPAISEEETADYTATTIVQTSATGHAYVTHAFRERINPTQIIENCFRMNQIYKPVSIGIEDVAFQRSILHFAHQEMLRRKHPIPLHGVKRSPDKTKYMRIMSLVPRFEWGMILLAQGLHDLEMELATFPRGAHDDILDALSSIFEIASFPTEERKRNEPPAPTSSEYESWYREHVLLPRVTNQGRDEDGSDSPGDDG